MKITLKNGSSLILETTEEKIHIDCLFSYRTLERIAELETVVPNIFENLQTSLFKGLDSDDIEMTYKEISSIPGMRFNKYVQALSDHNLTITKEGIKSIKPFEFF